MNKKIIREIERELDFNAGSISRKEIKALTEVQQLEHKIYRYISKLKDQNTNPKEVWAQ